MTTVTELVETSMPEQAGLVSVVIIFLDEERFLREAIESVLAQDYPHWGLLLMDDGFTDTAPAIAQAFVRKHARIRYPAHPSGQKQRYERVAQPRSLPSRGEYVAFVTADDIYLPKRLRRRAEALAALPSIAMTVSSQIRWYDPPTRRSNIV